MEICKGNVILGEGWVLAPEESREYMSWSRKPCSVSRGEKKGQNHGHRHQLSGRDKATIKEKRQSEMPRAGDPQGHVSVGVGHQSGDNSISSQEGQEWWVKDFSWE